ncbi:MAG: hypothetical protein HY791_35610 [Deltaproteobacteria bacterium]|nr:hypothetical protein [Deltaproteobacteria bacterium]
MLSSLALGALACGEVCKPSTSGTSFRFDEPSPVDFWSHPWPSDARKTQLGTLSLLGFPNPTESSTLDEYLTAIQTHTRGYSTNGASYLSFSGPLDTSSLPGGPLDAIASESSIFLVDVSDTSPERGRRYPLEVRAHESASLYLPADVLSILPPYGIPLRSGTTYALVGTSALRAKDKSGLVQSAELHDALYEECDGVLSSLISPLRTFLEREGIAKEDVRAATVFSTQDVIGEMRLLADVARQEPTPTLENVAFDGTEQRFDLWTAEISMPAFQRGEPPYAEPGAGGGIDFAEGPKVTHHERVRVSISVPEGEMPASGWPTVLYAHGTYGDYRSVVDEDLAFDFTQLGFAVLGYDQTLHGPRDPSGGDPGLNFFNLFNIVAGRDNVRQGGVDGVVMTKLIEETTLPYFGGEVRFDPERIAFLGHSQGGISGSPLVAVEPALRAAVFSGTSGILAITVQERTDPVSFSGLLRTLLSLPDSEDLDDHHVLMTLIQTFIEPGDPINFARSYLQDPACCTAKDVLLIEGFKDFASPARGHEALATAARVPVIAPVFRIPFASTLIGPEPQEAPAFENLEGPFGKVTMGLIQYPDQDHWPLFEDKDAHAKALEFLRSALVDGRARIPK